MTVKHTEAELSNLSLQRGEFLFSPPKTGRFAGGESRTQSAAKTADKFISQHGFSDTSADRKSLRPHLYIQ